MRRFLNHRYVAKPGALLPRCTILAVTVIGALLLVGCSKAAPTEVTLQAAKMKQTGGITAADGGVTFWQNGSLSTSINLNKGPVTIALQAAGHTVDDQGPEVTVRLNGQPVGRLNVTSTSPREYAVNADVEKAGTITVELTFANHVQKRPPVLSRWLMVKSVTFSQGA